MPLYLRLVEPVNVGRAFSKPLTGRDKASKGYKSSEVVDSHEEAANRTLSNIIRQIGSLGLHANDIFEKLENDTSNLVKRAQDLRTKVDDIAKNLQETGNDLVMSSSAHVNELLNPNQDSGISTNIGSADKNFSENNPEWKAVSQEDSGLFTKASRPNAINQMYTLCETVPRLDKLQEFRDDNKICIKQYSDPEMFFAIWSAGILENSKKQRLQREASKIKKKNVKKQSRKEFKGAKLKTRAERLRQKEEEAGNVTMPRPKKIRDEKILQTQDSFEIPPPDYEDPAVLRNTSKIIQDGAHRVSKHVKIVEPNQEAMFSDQTDVTRESMIPTPPPELLDPRLADYEIDDDADFPSPPILDSVPGPSGNGQIFIRDLPAPRFPDQEVPDIDVDILPPPQVMTPTRPAPDIPLNQQPFKPIQQAPLPAAPPVPPAPPAPPSPPPPPPMLGIAESLTSRATHDSMKSEEGHKEKPLAQKAEVPKVPDERNDLLKQIREGMKLRKVPESERRENTKPKTLDTVADILNQVMDDRFGKLHSETDTSTDEEDEDWFEDNEFSD